MVGVGESASALKDQHHLITGLICVSQEQQTSIQLKSPTASPFLTMSLKMRWDKRHHPTLPSKYSDVSVVYYGTFIYARDYFENIIRKYHGIYHYIFGRIIGCALENSHVNIIVHSFQKHHPSNTKLSDIILIYNVCVIGGCWHGVRQEHVWAS